MIVNAKADESQMAIDNIDLLMRQGQMLNAIEQASQYLKKFPDAYVVWNMLGISAARLGQLDLAKNAFEAAIKVNKNFLDGFNNLGNIFRNQQRFDEAVKAYNQAVALEPNFAEAHNNLGVSLKESGNLVEAEKSIRRAIALKPDYADAHSNLGWVKLEKGDFDEAKKVLEKALRMKPDSPDTLQNLGTALLNEGKAQEAIKCYKKAILLDPKRPNLRQSLGAALSENGDFEAAEASLNMAISIDPHCAEAHRSLTRFKKYSAGDPHLKQMLSLLAENEFDAESRCHLYFAVSKAFGDLCDYATSFGYLKKGNSLRKKNLGYNASKEELVFDEVKKASHVIKEKSLPLLKRCNGPVPIFIVGMPRSGTTLVEQILSSHTKINGLGELPYFRAFGHRYARGEFSISSHQLLQIRNKYLAKIQSLSNGGFFSTDKLPHNFFNIALIKSAIPEAKIIHVKRNSAATCWSNYKTYFTSDLNYCYDLEDLVSYYNLYTQLMQFWEDLFPGAIHTTNYENLTTNQKYETKSLLNFLNLGWENACLTPQKNNRSVRTASNIQIRKGIYKGSSEVWKSYEPFLDDAFTKLDT